MAEGILNRLNEIVDEMELLVDPQALSEPLQEQYNQLVVLVQRYTSTIAELSPSDQQVCQEALNRLGVRVGELRISLVNAMNRDVSTVNETIPVPSDERMETESSMANVDHPDNNKLPKVQENVPNANVSQDNVNLQSVAEVNQPQQPQPNGMNVNIPIEQNPTTNGNVTASVNDAVAEAMNGTSEFSFQTLILYNAMFNELVTLEQMPEKAQPVHFRRLRDFITRFVRLCVDNRLNMAVMEAMLLPNIVAAFNAEVFNHWKYMMISNKASLRTIREFLATQEELAGDRTYRESRFTLASAIKAAQKLTGTQSENPKNYDLPKSQEEAKSRSNKPTPSMPARPRDAAGCSSWEDGAWGGGSTKSGDPGSSDNSSEKKSCESKGAIKKKEGEKKRSFKCFACGESHPLFFCPRYLDASLEARWRFVKEKGICPLCLLEKHPLLECPDRSCKQCPNDGAHNSTLCRKSYENKKRGFPPKKDESK